MQTQFLQNFPGSLCFFTKMIHPAEVNFSPKKNAVILNPAYRQSAGIKGLLGFLLLHPHPILTISSICFSTATSMKYSNARLSNLERYDGPQLQDR
jgi:hypothetical protein